MVRLLPLALLASLPAHALLFAPPVPVPVPTLTVSALTAGAPMRLTVTNVDPGETVHFAASLAGTGTGPCLPSGPCLDLLDPVEIIAKADANAEGWVSVVVPVPAGAPDGLAVSFQAGVLRGPAGVDSLATNTVDKRVGPAACFLLYAPVCGLDGVTYSNSCFAEVAGWPVAYSGACSPA